MYVYFPLPNPHTTTDTYAPPSPLVLATARKADMNDTVGEVLSADGALLFRTLGTEGRASDTFRVHSTAVHDAEMSLVSLQSWFSRGIFCVVSLGE